MEWLFPGMRRRSREVTALLQKSKEDLDEALVKNRHQAIRTAIKADDNIQRAAATEARADGVRHAVESLLEDMRKSRDRDDENLDIT